jgi:hypothetical protein
MSDDSTQTSSLTLAAIALGTLAVFCFMAWSMFSDSKTAFCVTKGRFAARDDIHIHDVRWSPSDGCEYYASIVKPGLDKAERRKAVISTANALWMPEARVIRDRSGR